MFMRVVTAAQVVLFAAAVSGWAAEEAKTYSGTFKDSQGREGPISCTMASKEGGKYELNFTAKNTGKGPNRELKCTGELAGKTEGAKADLSGEIAAGRGQYTVAATLDGKSLKATFKNKDGKSDGSFDLTLGEAAPAAKADPATDKPAAKKDADKPKDK